MDTVTHSISPIANNVKDIVLIEKPDFDIKHFIALTDSLLTSIEVKRIQLNVTVDSTSTKAYHKRRFNFDPGKGNRILRLWIEITTYNNKNDLDKDFKKLQKDGSSESEEDMIPGLTYTNDYVMKTNKHIVWLNTGCVYAFFNHQKVQQNLLKSLNTGPIADSIICQCGGRCN